MAAGRRVYNSETIELQGQQIERQIGPSPSCEDPRSGHLPLLPMAEEFARTSWLRADLDTGSFAARLSARRIQGTGSKPGAVHIIIMPQHQLSDGLTVSTDRTEGPYQWYTSLQVRPSRTTLRCCPVQRPGPARSSVNHLLQVVDNLQFQNVSHPILHRRSQCPLGASTTREARKTNNRQLGLLYRWGRQTDPSSWS
jgi:hypothetical protein